MMGGKKLEKCWTVNKHQVGDLFEMYDDAQTYKP
jgi:hypothetical protein